MSCNSMVTLEVNISGKQFSLHPTGAIWWEQEGILLIADPHFGKISDFRKNGLAVPSAVKGENYKKLDGLIEEYQPGHLIFLGDLFHHTRNREFEVFLKWSAKLKCKQTLVLGNHDRYIAKELAVGCLVVRDELIVQDMLLTHMPTQRTDLFNFCGHIHPSVVLHGGGMSVKSRCFVQYDRQLILPAFGSFTGTQKVNINDCLHVYVNTSDEVIQVR